MLTAKKFAGEIGKPYSTVALWLKDNRIPEAERHELEGDKIFYLIPAAVVEKYKSASNQPKRGRPKAAEAQVGAATAGGTAAADEAESKPKRRASNRTAAKKALKKMAKKTKG